MQEEFLRKLSKSGYDDNLIFDAILHRFELTGRMKDFYDIYYLARTFDFDGATLQTAMFETLQQRGTPYNRDSFKRIVSLAEDEDMQKRWDSKNLLWIV